MHSACGTPTSMGQWLALITMPPTVVVGSNAMVTVTVVSVVVALPDAYAGFRYGVGFEYTMDRSAAARRVPTVCLSRG